MARLRERAASGTGQYMAAIGVRTAARAGWSLALPALLPVAVYGRYSVLIALSVVVVQFATLGAPQAIIREAGRTLPVLGLVMHALLLGVVGAVGASLLSPSGGRDATLVLAANVAAGVVLGLLGARAKARLAFGTVLRAESVCGGVLLASTLGLLLSVPHAGSWSASAAVAVECVAAGAAVAWYLAERRTRMTAGELTARGTAALLPSVYGVGGLAMLDVAVLRRVEIYFLEHSPSGLTGVAVVSVALQLSNMLLLPAAAMLDAWQPRLAVAFRGDPGAFAEALRSRARRFGAAWVGLVVASMVLPTLAVSLVLRKYDPWCWTIVGVVLARSVCGGAGLCSSVLYAVGLQRWLVVPCVGGACVAVVANAWLTPRLGLPGAVGAHLLTQATVAGTTLVAYAYAARRHPALALWSRRTA
ncbi:hypothetical protein tb265_41900 [Gemmatimonadetes bacterium T265]|nr:hypothetical protein tb265_41900 [Gemmatimonadetes bacterium T265]